MEKSLKLLELEKRTGITIEQWIEHSKEIDRKIENGEFDISKEEQDLIDHIKSLPLNTLEDIQNAKEQARPLSFSTEKILLFKYLITHEDNIKGR